MKIRYKNSKLKKLCTNKQKAIKEHGENVANRLMLRLLQIESASNPTELKAGKPHALKGNRLGQYAMSLDKKTRLVFRAEEPRPLSDDGGIDWKSVSIIEIIYIGDYHE